MKANQLKFMFFAKRQKKNHFWLRKVKFRFFQIPKNRPKWKKMKFSLFEVKNDYFLVASRKREMEEYFLLNGSLSPSQKINISKVKSIFRYFPVQPKNTTQNYRKMTLTFEILIFCERLNEPFNRKYSSISFFREATRKYSFLTSKSGKVDFLRSRPVKTKK